MQLQAVDMILYQLVQKLRIFKKLSWAPRLKRLMPNDPLGKLLRFVRLPRSRRSIQDNLALVLDGIKVRERLVIRERGIPHVDERRVIKVDLTIQTWEPIRQ